MDRLSMIVIRPKRRKEAGYLARWIDPVSGRRCQKTLGTRIKREADTLAAELAKQVESGSVIGGLPWLEFCERYEQQALHDKSEKTIQAWRTVKWFIDEHCPLQSIQQANDLWFDRFFAAVHAKEASKNTHATYLTKLRAALRWAGHKRYLRQVPFIVVKWDKKPRSNAVSSKQFAAMLKAIPVVRCMDGPLWRRLLRGQFFTGLRISELLALSWDDDADVRIVERKHPAIFFGKQKNKQRQERPLVPEAWEIIADMPGMPVHQGFVFPIPGKSGQMTTKAAIKVIAAIGVEAGAVTNKETGKHATSHDIRRAFYSWASDRYGKKIGSLLMRHADEETSDTYYNTDEAEKLAELLWEKP
jgi:integrase